MYTILEHLQNIQPLATEEMVMAVLAERGIDFSTTYEELEEKQRDLSKADVLWSVCMLPSTVGGNEEQVGSWRRKVSGSTMTSADRRILLAEAKRLYEKWEEEWPHGLTSGAVIIGRGYESECESYFIPDGNE